MENIGGIFVVLICGLIIAVFVAVMEFVWSTRRSAETDEVSVCQEMLSEFRNAVSCRKSSRSRSRRRRHGFGSGILRPPARPLRLVRDMRLSNGKLYGLGAPGGPAVPELGPGPQRLLEETLGLNFSDVTAPTALALAPPTALVAPPTALIAPPTALVAPPPPPPPRSFLQNCSHVRICQECRRIQSLRSYAPPPQAAPRPPHPHFHRGSMSLPRLPRHAPPPPALAAERADSEGDRSPRRSKTRPLPPPRPLPLPNKAPPTTTDLLGGHD